MIVSNFHKEPTALDTVLHRDLRLNNELDAAYLLAPFTSFMITLNEFAEASRDFPILFMRAAPDALGKETVAPVATFGLRPGENLFYKDGRWDAGYFPAMLRAYPFTMARIEGSDRWAMIFDNTWQGFSRTEGKPLFDDQGQATQLLKDAHQFVQDVETDIERTRQACAVLMELKLLKPMRFDATLANGETLSVDGFWAIDEEAIVKLPDAKIAQLYRNGILHMLQTHHLSMNNMPRLADRRFAQMQRQPQQNPEAANS
jgi:hypothetical protein